MKPAEVFPISGCDEMISKLIITLSWMEVMETDGTAQRIKFVNWTGLAQKSGGKPSIFRLRLQRFFAEALESERDH
jgi:hypothetical protein